MTALGLGACGPTTDKAVAPAAVQGAAAPGCDAPGFLKARLYGEISADLDWSGTDLECAGMPRPNGAGARLHFVGRDHDGDRELAFIVAIPDFGRDSVGQELSSTVTLIEVGGGRFFSTASAGNCVAEVSDVAPLDGPGDRSAIRGALYCVSPLAEVNGSSSVSIPELRFGGQIDWNSS